MSRRVIVRKELTKLHRLERNLKDSAEVDSSGELNIHLRSSSPSAQGRAGTRPTTWASFRNNNLNEIKSLSAPATPSVVLRDSTPSSPSIVLHQHHEGFCGLGSEASKRKESRRVWGSQGSADSDSSQHQAPQRSTSFGGKSQLLRSNSEQHQKHHRRTKSPSPLARTQQQHTPRTTTSSFGNSSDSLQVRNRHSKSLSPHVKNSNPSRKSETLSKNLSSSARNLENVKKSSSSSSSTSRRQSHSVRNSYPVFHSEKEDFEVW